MTTDGPDTPSAPGAAHGRDADATQQQFLNVIDRDEAERRFHAALCLEPLGLESLPLAAALGRILARDVVAAVDVPSFDRSNVDGFAVQAGQTTGATEQAPVRLWLNNEVIATAVQPQITVEPGTASTIATGGMLPRGADAVVMVEYTEAEDGMLVVRRAVAPGAAITFAGTDVSAGETVLRRGQMLTSRETGVLAAIGCDRVEVWRRPRVAILSTGDEIIDPGQPMRPGLVYDSNARIIADAVRELGGEPHAFGTVADDLTALQQRFDAAMADSDVVVLSGGTSKGAGDLSYHVVRGLNDPGIVAHGVALKPGKPICLAVTGGKPVVILPGFPTSAVFTFHEFLAPVIRRLAGQRLDDRATVAARLAVKVRSDAGRTEYLLVGLVDRGDADGGTPALAAYPMGKGSGSVTTFSRADGFITIGRHDEMLERDAVVDVQLLGRDLKPADLVVIGSHCVGLDDLVGRLEADGMTTKFIAVGSTGGLQAAQAGECDLAGIHLLDVATGIYNRPFLTDDVVLIPGYGRMQGLVYRRGDARFEDRSMEEAIAAVGDDPACRMVNRNQGSGTRILIDRLLQRRRPAGYAIQARNHNAVVAAIAQGRADWGVAIAAVAGDLGFLPIAWEQYDFVVPKRRLDRPAVTRFRKLLESNDVIDALQAKGFFFGPDGRNTTGQSLQ